MFSSIKWKFVVIYFILIFIAMIISGVFIVENLKIRQIANIKTNMERTAQTIISTSSYLSEDEWIDNSSEIQSDIDDWRIGSNEIVFVIDTTDAPTIVASSSKAQGILSSIYINEIINPLLVDKAVQGEKSFDTYVDLNTGKNFEHMAYPVMSNTGSIKGIIYMTSDLQSLNDIIRDTTEIIVRAILIALSITVILGFVVASSITEPIKNVTKKAELMAKGDFNQFVEVKSNDEIGQLATMFNYLTGKLNRTISEKDLEKSKLDTIFQYMTEGVVAVDANSDIIHANPIAVELLGYSSSEEAEGTEFPKAILDLKKESEVDASSDSVPEKLMTIDSLVYKIKYAPFKNEEEESRGWIVVFQDLTKEHKLDEIRKEFVANVSHELKTPLTTIKTYTETLLDMNVEGETEKNFLKVIDKEADRMTRLVRDLLELSNIDFEKTEWSKENSSIKTLISEVLVKLDYSINQKGHTLNLDLDDVPNINMNKDSIERVLMNVISNSVKYTENGGEISINLRRKGNFADITIRDNGIGIPEKDLQRVYERFYRVEKGRSREMGGTGLGLSIAKEIIEGHGGSILMQSKVGAGTVTEIKLPLSN